MFEWTNEKPTISGWYWYRCDKNSQACIVLVKKGRLTSLPNIGQWQRVRPYTEVQEGL